MTTKEKEELKQSEQLLQHLQNQEASNQAELDKIMKRAKDAQAKAKKHESFRQKRIQMREAKKMRKRAAFAMVWKIFKAIIIIVGILCVTVGVIAIAGCEMGVDGLKESFVCSIGKPPPRRLKCTSRRKQRVRSLSCCRKLYKRTNEL